MFTFLRSGIAAREYTLLRTLVPSAASGACHGGLTWGPLVVDGEVGACTDSWVLPMWTRQIRSNEG